MAVTWASVTWKLRDWAMTSPVPIPPPRTRTRLSWNPEQSSIQMPAFDCMSAWTSASSSCTPRITWSWARAKPLAPRISSVRRRSIRPSWRRVQLARPPNPGPAVSGPDTP